MKKILILSFGLILILASCNGFGKKVTESSEYKQLQAERDSLKAATQTKDSEAEEMMSIINEVEANFASIREAQNYLSRESGNQGEMNSDTKDKVNNNFKMIQDILKKNKEQIDLLNKKFANGNQQNATLKSTIEKLNEDLKNQSEELVKLQEGLSARDEKIEQLSNDIVEISNTVDNQARTIKEQETSLHTAYFVFGTMSELKEQKILSGGFMKSTKVLQDTFNKDYFIKIDIRKTTEIQLYATKAKVWSNHPNDSYELVKADDGKLTLVVTDTQRFWSLTKYLIVEVK